MEFLTALTLSMGISTHVGLEENYNEIHPHVRYHNEQFITGVYYNSENKISMYGGYRMEPKQNVGIEITMVTGYEQIGTIVPYARVTYDINSNTRFYVAPTVEKQENETKPGIVFGVEIQNIWITQF